VIVPVARFGSNKISDTALLWRRRRRLFPIAKFLANKVADSAWWLNEIRALL
jgi:hypothetical protein